MGRPVFTNEVIGSYGSSTDPQYTITHAGGTLSNAKLTLNNAITNAGTALNADTLNKLVDFDNSGSFKGLTRKTEIGSTTITETVFDGTAIAAQRVTTFAASAITETVTLYNEGGAVARATTSTTTMPTTGDYKIIEEVA